MMGGTVPLSRHLMNTVLSNLIRTKKKNQQTREKDPFYFENSNAMLKITILYITRSYGELWLVEG